jgi:hypothetical protein
MGNSIGEVLLKFSEMDKAGIEFNSELASYKLQQRDNLEEDKIINKFRIKAKGGC